MTSYKFLRYFVADEFVCHCGCGRGEEEMNPDFLRKLDLVRGLYGKPLRITSGYRCEEHDKAVGGKGNHPLGLAADLLVPDPQDRVRIVEACAKAGIERILVYKDKPHVHVDMTRKRKGLFVV